MSSPDMAAPTAQISVRDTLAPAGGTESPPFTALVQSRMGGRHRGPAQGTGTSNVRNARDSLCQLREDSRVD